MDNAAIEADDEQRPDVDADGHVSALLRASAGRATLRAAAATLDEHQPSVAASSCANSDGDVCPGDKSSDGPSSACAFIMMRGAFARTYVCSQ